MRRAWKTSLESSPYIFQDPETRHMLELLNKLEALEAKWECMEEIGSN